MDHAPFILAAYGVTALVFAGLVIWLIADGRIQRRKLATLEKAGVSRRSTGRPQA